MQASFNVENYLSYDEIKAIVREEIQYEIQQNVKAYLKSVSIDKLIGYAAKEFVLQLCEEQDVDVYSGIASKVQVHIDGLQSWNVFYDHKDYGKSKGQIVLDECVEEARPKIQQKVDEIIEDKLNASWLIDEVVDTFYQKLCDQLIGK